MVKFNKSFNSLAGKLIMFVGAVMTLGSLAFGFIIYKYEEGVTLRNITSHARFSTSLVLRGLHNGMLTARRDVIQTTLEEQGALPDVKNITVYDTAGKAVYTSNPKRLGSSLDPTTLDFMTALGGESTEPTIHKSAGEGKVLSSFTPIKNQLSCYTATCHFHKRTDEILGVLYTSFSAAPIENAGRQILGGTLIFGAIFVATISFALCVILYKFVSKPVALIEEGMKRVARGDFEHPIKIETSDEMGTLAGTFNVMARDIDRYEQKLKNWAAELQKEVDLKAKEILDAQEQLVNAEKLASLGRMSAGVAHELNSPLTGIVTYAYLMLERLPESDKENREDLSVIIEQAQRCSKIIKGLLRFSRKGGSEKVAVNINDLLESCVSMVQNQRNFHNISVNMHMSTGLPSIVVDSNQIQQVILNLLSNAADAMNETGTLTIRTGTASEGSAEYLEMAFTDTGSGILPEHLGRIFEPFFTTKPVGKGTGLGLPVSYGIIKRHGGDILVRSKAGEGTTFTVRLPVSRFNEGENSSEEAAHEQEST